MKMTVIKIIVPIMLSIFCFSCLERPRIEIDDELKEKLIYEGNYSYYVELLNNTLENGKLEDLIRFLKIHYFEDISSDYSHGKVLLTVLEKLGDDNFSKGLFYLNKYELSWIEGYFLIRFDVMDVHEIEELRKKYPKSFGIMEI